MRVLHGGTRESEKVTWLWDKGGHATVLPVEMEEGPQAEEGEDLWRVPRRGPRSPSSPQRISAQGHPGLASGTQNSQMTNLCFFKPLNMWVSGTT